MVYIVGASSLHYALGRNIRERRQLPEVITKSGYNLHPQAKDKLKIFFSSNQSTPQIGGSHPLARFDKQLHDQSEV